MRCTTYICCKYLIYKSNDHATNLWKIVSDDLTLYLSENKKNLTKQKNG